MCRRAVLTICLLIVILLSTLAVDGPDSPFVIEKIAARDVGVFSRGLLITRLSGNGDLFVLEANYKALWALRRLPGPESNSQPLRYELPATDWLLADLAVDANGAVYIPAMWMQQNQTETGVLVFDRRGQYQRTIVLTPPVEARHIAVGDDGTVFVLGVDAEYMAHRTNDCLLIHKYSAEGRRIADFPECTHELRDRRQALLPTPAAEVDRGQLWVQNGLVYQLLPESRRVRVFEQTGNPLRSILLEPPASGSFARMQVEVGSARVAYIAALPENRFFAMWFIGSQSVSRSLNGPDGRLVSRIDPPDSQGIPVSVDDAGYVYFLNSLPNGHQELVKARISAR